MDKQLVNGLVKQAMEGSEAAFEQLCEQIVHDVLYLCIRYTGNYHTGEDAAQEVLVYLQKGIVHLRNADAFYAWLNRCIAGTCHVMTRKAKRIITFPFEEYGVEIVEDRMEFLPLEWAEQEQMREIVLSALRTLSVKYQQVLFMFYFEDMSLHSMADALQMSEGNVRVTLHRARKALKARVEKDNKLQLEEYKLGGALLAPLTLILRNDALNLIREESSKRIVEAVVAGAGGLGAAGAAATGASAAAAGGSATTVVTAGGVVAGVTSTTILSTAALALTGTVLVGTVVAASIFGSSASSPPAEEPVLPQSAVTSWSGGEEAEEPSMAEPEASSILEEWSRNSSSQPLLTGDAGPEAVAQTVRGRLALYAQGGEVLGSGGYGAGFIVEIYLDGNRMAEERVDANGSFELTFAATVGTGYTLQLQAQDSRRCVFNSGSATASIPFTASGETLSLPVVYLADNEAPTGAITLHGHGQSDLQGGRINPVAASLTVYDATDTAVHWQVFDANGLPIAQGTGVEIDLVQAGIVATAQGSLYTLEYTMTDAGGNTATAQRSFWRQL